MPTSDPTAAGTPPWQPWHMGQLPTPPAAAPVADEELGATAPQPDPLEALHTEAAAQAAREGFEQGRADGYERGYAEGLEAARAQGELELASRRQALAAPWAALLDGLHHELDRLDAEIGDALADVALAVGHKLAGDALDARPRHVATLIRGLLQEEPLMGDRPSLRLHPEDAALIDAELAGDLARNGWKVLPDAAIQRGGCRIAGSAGELDATRATRWQSLQERARRLGGPPRRRATRRTTQAPAQRT